MMAKQLTANTIAIGLLLMLVACAQAPRQEASLYDQLGKYEGIEAIVVELIHVIAADDRLRARYEGVNMNQFKKGLSDYICSISAGPCQYSGDSIKVIHAGHQYTNTEFNAIVADLIKAMEHKSVPVSTQNQLLSVLATSYRDVVYQ